MSSIPSLRTIPISAGESLLVESGAMKAYSDEKITMSTGIHSVFSAFSRSLSGENILINTFTASSKEAGWIALEESNPGGLVEHKLQPGDSLILKRGEKENGPFVASTPNITLTPTITNIHGYLSNLGFFALQASNCSKKEGRLFFNSEEGIVSKLEITPQTPVVIDNNNILAYSGSLSLSTTAPGGAISWVYGGEGLATRFKGTGTVYLGASKH